MLHNSCNMSTHDLPDISGKPLLPMLQLYNVQYRSKVTSHSLALLLRVMDTLDRVTSALYTLTLLNTLE